MNATKHQVSPQVSVVIPAYNQAHYLDTAIQSVLGQNYRDFEIIVVDDGSTDHTAAVASQYGDTIRYIFQSNVGLAGARNTGILASEGKFIALLDSDDVWCPQYLETMMDVAISNPDAAVYYCGVNYIDADGSALPQQGTITPVPSAELYHLLLRYNPLIPSATILRRAIVVKTGLFDVRFRRLQDWELWIRLLRNGCTFAGYDGSLVLYRIHSSSLSTDGTGGLNAARMLVETHFGQDDGQWAMWQEDRRRAYGGFYRYCALIVALLRQDDWQLCGRYLRQALQVDPTLADDLSLYYELALGTQPPGYRGELNGLDLLEQKRKVELVLATIFALPLPTELAIVQQRSYATAYCALALLAHQMRQTEACRRWLLQAISYQPRLAFDNRIVKLLAQSLIGRTATVWLRQPYIKVRRLLRARGAKHVLVQ